MGFLSQLRGFDTRSLDLLQRVLLITDGTLTDVVEAAFLEPIVLVKVAMAVSSVPARIEPLDLEAGAAVMERKILLRGQNSGVNFVYAESLLALDRLDPQFRAGLLESDKPMGRLWSEYRIETWKEILEVFRRPVGDLAQFFSSATTGGLLVRRYRAFSGGRPIMLITEYFPERY